MKWLADENFRGTIVRGIYRRSPRFDLLRVQDLPQIASAVDDEVLAWATQHGRIVLTHDLSTMIPAMQTQMHKAHRCAAIVMVPDTLPIVEAIESIILLDECSIPDDWIASVIYLPLG